MGEPTRGQRRSARREGLVRKLHQEPARDRSRDNLSLRGRAPARHRPHPDLPRDDRTQHLWPRRETRARVEQSANTNQALASSSSSFVRAFRPRARLRARARSGPDSESARAGARRGGRGSKTRDEGRRHILDSRSSFMISIWPGPDRRRGDFNAKQSRRDAKKRVLRSAPFCASASPRLCVEFRDRLRIAHNVRGSSYCRRECAGRAPTRGPHYPGMGPFG